MINPQHELSITKQAKALSVARSTVYYKPKPLDENTLKIMECIDRFHTDFPFAGSRMMRDLLKNSGIEIGRKRTRSLMRKMGISAIYSRPRTTKPTPNHKVFPYLLRGVEIAIANKVWAMDITYIPMERGFCYLVAVLDWFSRKLLAWRLSNTMTVQFCLDAFEDAAEKYGEPEILNTDQGSQFTSHRFVDKVTKHETKLIMDGKGAWRDNVFIERFWRSLKYEEVYLFAYENLRKARKGIDVYIEKYNKIRPHQKHNGKTPAMVYYENLPLT